MSSGTLLELATGEGKSLVIAALATIKALQGIKIEVACSSSILAMRDQNEWKSFFDVFGLKSSVISNISRSMVREVYECDIVYGTVHDFSADVLKQEFDGQTTRSKRQFECLIIDEVDNMTIDNCLQQTLLSSKATGMHHLNSLFIKIWQHVIGFFPLPDEVGFFNSPQFFVTGIQSLLNLEVSGESRDNDKKADESLLDGFFGILSIISKDGKFTSFDKIEHAYKKSESRDQFMKNCRDIIKEELTSNEEFSFERNICNILTDTFEIDANIYVIDENNWPKRFYKSQTSSNKMIIFPNGDIALYFSKKETEELIQKEVLKVLDQERTLIPTYLHPHVRKMTPKFIENAFLVAYSFNEGEHYKISKSLDANGSDDAQYDSAISVDFISTGMLQKNMKYSGGIQQFLEMKHQLAMSEVTLTTNFISNFCFYQRYNTIFGLTGTLGNEADKVFLQEELDLNSFTVPSHKESRIRYCPILIEETEELWRTQVIENAVAVASSGQAVLIICNDMNTAEAFNEYLLKITKYEEKKIVCYWMDDVHKLPDKVKSKYNDLEKHILNYIYFRQLTLAILSLPRHWQAEELISKSQI